jgi:hypothetical protein
LHWGICLCSILNKTSFSCFPAASSSSDPAAPQQQQHQQQQQQQQAQSASRSSTYKLRNEIYDFLFGTISNQFKSPSTTTETTQKFMEVVDKTGVYFTTIFGWFLIDQDYDSKYLDVSI